MSARENHDLRRDVNFIKLDQENKKIYIDDVEVKYVSAIKIKKRKDQNRDFVDVTLGFRAKLF